MAGVACRRASQPRWWPPHILGPAGRAPRAHLHVDVAHHVERGVGGEVVAAPEGHDLLARPLLHLRPARGAAHAAVMPRLAAQQAAASSRAHPATCGPLRGAHGGACRAARRARAAQAAGARAGARRRASPPAGAASGPGAAARPPRQARARTRSVLPMGKRQPSAFSQCRYCSSWQSTRYLGGTAWYRAVRAGRQGFESREWWR